MRRVWSRLVRITCVALLMAPALAAPARGQLAEWPTFRGPQRLGVSPETGLLQEWPKEGPKQLWQVAGMGRGYATVAIAGGKLFTLGDGLSTASDTDEYLICLDQETGKLLWRTKTGPAWTDSSPDWQSSRSTPTVDGERVYVVTPGGVLVCCQTADGKELWRTSLVDDLGGKKGDLWGYSESVLVDGEQVVCTPGGPTATMVALNKATGKVLWKTASAGDRGAGHSSMAIAEIGGVRHYVQATASGGLGVRASDGKVLWTFPIKEIEAVCPSPVVMGDQVFFVFGDRLGGALLKLEAQGDGVQAAPVYKLNPDLTNRHGGVVVVGGHIFGDSTDRGQPYCADLATGEVVWRKRASGKGSASFAAADGRLYIHFQNGQLVLAKADPTNYTEVGSFKLPGAGQRPSWAHPVICGGRLYVREGDTLLCYDIKAP